MFLHPLMLAWLPAALLPLLVSLISSTRSDPVPWGAMMFLVSPASGRRLHMGVRQWALLLLRTAAVVLLVVSLARPVVSARRFPWVPTAGLVTGGHVRTVIVLDDSASMGYTIAGKTRLDQARGVALQILSVLHHGDSAGLVLMGNSQGPGQINLGSDFGPIVARVAELTPSDGQADIADALDHVGKMLQNDPDTDSDICIICDQQSITWRRILDGSYLAPWMANQAGGWKRRPRVLVWPVGGIETDNLSVEGIDIVNPPAIRDHPADIAVRVRNFGSKAVTTPVTLWTGTRGLAETTVSVPGNSVVAVRMTARFGAAGSYAVSAAIKTTGLTFDDRLDRAVEVVEPIRVLLVNGDESATAAVLERSLRPLTLLGRRLAGPAVVTSIKAGNFSAAAMDRMNVVILNDTPRFDPSATQALEQFAYDGGGVWYIPGSSTDPAVFNHDKYRDGTGIFPAAINGVVRLQPPVNLNVVDRNHPLFRGMMLWKNASVNVQRLFPLIPRGGDVHTLARAGNLPVLLESPAGHGRVVMTALALDPAWTSLSRSPAMGDLAEAVVRYLGSAMVVDRNLFPSQPIAASIETAVDSQSVTVQLLPNGRREPAVVRRLEDHVEIRYSRTQSPGVYRVRYRENGTEQSLFYVVKPQRNESDLTPLAVSQWGTIAARTGATRQDPATSDFARIITLARGGREIWVDLLSCTLGLLVLETALSRWWTARG